jgi:hypothetical protein
VREYADNNITQTLTYPGSDGTTAALLRQLHAVITTGQRWDPAIAAGGRPSQSLAAALRQTHSDPVRQASRGEPHAAFETRNRDLAAHPGQPRRPHATRLHAAGHLCRDRRRRRAPGHNLDKNALR